MYDFWEEETVMRVGDSSKISLLLFFVGRSKSFSVANSEVYFKIKNIINHEKCSLKDKEGIWWM